MRLTMRPVIQWWKCAAHRECQARLVVTKRCAAKSKSSCRFIGTPTAKDSSRVTWSLPHTDAASGQPEFKHTPVVVRPCGYRGEAALVSDKVMGAAVWCWSTPRVEGGFLYRISSSKEPNGVEWFNLPTHSMLYHQNRMQTRLSHFIITVTNHSKITALPSWIIWCEASLRSQQ